MSSSSSSSATSTTNRDGRVATDGESIGISADGPVTVHMVQDELVEMGTEALREMGDLSRGTVSNVVDFTDGAINDVFNFTGNTIGDVLDLTREQNADIAQANANAMTSVSNALTATQTANRTETSQFAEQFLKTAVPVAALAFVAVQVMK